MSDKLNKFISESLLSNPAGFLKKHILLVPSPTANLNLSPARNFDFNFYSKKSGITTLFGSIDRGTLRAYYLPWGEDAGYHVVCEKGGDVNFMLTAQLSGCSVGYVKATDGSGAVRVSHHNIQTSQGRSDQAAMQKSMAFTQASVQPSDYRPDADSLAYVYGVKKKGIFGGRKWRFYTQKLKQVALGDYEIISVSEMK